MLDAVSASTLSVGRRSEFEPAGQLTPSDPATATAALDLEADPGDALLLWIDPCGVDALKLDRLADHAPLIDEPLEATAGQQDFQFALTPGCHAAREAEVTAPSITRTRRDS